MELSKGVEQLKQSIDEQLTNELRNLNTLFLQTKDEMEDYVRESSGAVQDLKSYSVPKEKRQRGKEPDGFMYGYELIPAIQPEEKIYFPLVYPFQQYGLTAIEEETPCSQVLFNFLLRSIISYPLGDCNVYMVDSNVSGDFNLFSEISTRLNDAEADKPYFHYITDDGEKDQLLTDLSSIIDSNIRNYVSKFSDLCSYNVQNQKMHVPYHFVFIKDISSTFPEKSQIDRLSRLARSQNATKAGVFIFFSYHKNVINDTPDNYYTDTYKAVKNLLSLSNIIRGPKRIFVESELILEPKATPEIADRVVEFVKSQKPPLTIMSFKESIMKQLEKGTLWAPPFKRESGHLPIPVGFSNAVTPKVVDIMFKKISPHIFIGGKTGSGKSVLLHNFIVNGALRYSPEQLQFYLVDMKGGVSFAPYKRLPHVVALSASSSRHYAMSLLELFSEENRRRLALFKRKGAASLDQYNEIVSKDGGKQMPYLFGIIDEFQVLFDTNDEISKNAENKIREIHRLSRAAGIFLALCTQQAPGNVDRSQVGIKMALVCNPNDSNTLLGNTGASRLRGIGRAIINTNDTGEEKYNQEFQVAFIHEDKELPLYIEKIRDIYLKQHQGVDPLDHLCYDDNDSRAILPAWMVPIMAQQAESLVPYIYVGVPGFFRKEHVKLRFHRESQSNVAIVGNDRPTALRLTGSIILQFISAYKKNGARVYISDLQKQTEPTYGKLAFLGGLKDITHTSSMEVKDTMNEVYQLLCQRKENPSQSVSMPEVLYALMDIKPDSNFKSGNSISFSFDAPAEKTTMEMLNELIAEGPDYGIHVLAYSFNFTNMDNILNNLNNSLLPMMEIKIALRGGNSAKLIRFYGSGELVEKWGMGVIHMPEDMGLRYNSEEDFGDPMLVYDTLEDKKLQGTPWETLFKNLPNKED